MTRHVIALRGVIGWPRLLLAVMLIPAFVAGAKGEEAKPNIVVILADDLGYGDTGFNNPECKIPTPNLDAMAGEGVRFVDAHSAGATCTPSRYGLLTGINPARTGVLNTTLSNGRPVISENEKTIADFLRDHGYATRMVGKWHLGYERDRKGGKPRFDFSKPLVGGPLDRGFDSFFGIHSSHGAEPYFLICDRAAVAEPTEKTVAKNAPWALREIAPGYDHRAVAPQMCDEALRIIREHAASGSGKPLFLYYAMTSPHAPWLPTAEFEGKSGIGPYGDFVMQLDAEFGRVRLALKETGMDRNTLLVFTSDNGPGPDAVEVSAPSGHACAGPFRGQKSDSWEGGHRVPFLAVWPGNIPPGTTSSTPFNGTDFFATFAALVGGEASHSAVPKDSHNMLAALRNPEKRCERPPMFNTADCIREGDWKLVSKKKKAGPMATSSSSFGLYNLAEDLGESDDRSESESARVRSMFGAYKTFISEREMK